LHNIAIRQSSDSQESLVDACLTKMFFVWR